MLYRLTLPTRINGHMQGPGFIFDLPDGTPVPGTHVQGQAGQLEFRPYAEPLTPHEVEEYEAHEATLAAEAEAARDAAREATLKAQDEPPPSPPKGQRARLTTPAIIDGALREAGYEFFLHEGEKGPTRAVREGHERIDFQKDSQRIDADVVDEPLYEIVKD